MPPRNVRDCVGHARLPPKPPTDRPPSGETAARTRCGQRPGSNRRPTAFRSRRSHVMGARMRRQSRPRPVATRPVPAGCHQRCRQYRPLERRRHIVARLGGRRASLRLTAGPTSRLLAVSCTARQQSRDRRSHGRRSHSRRSPAPSPARRTRRVSHPSPSPGSSIPPSVSYAATTDPVSGVAFLTLSNIGEVLSAARRISSSTSGAASLCTCTR